MAVSSVVCGPASSHSKTAFQSGDAANGWVPQRIDGCSLLFPPPLPMPPQGADDLATPPSIRPGSLNILQAPPSLLCQLATACRNSQRFEPRPVPTANTALRNDVQIDANSMGITNRQDTHEVSPSAISSMHADRQSATANRALRNDVQIDVSSMGITNREDKDKVCSFSTSPLDGDRQSATANTTFFNDVRVDVSSMGITNREDTDEAFSPENSPLNVDRQSASANTALRNDVQIDVSSMGITNREDTDEVFYSAISPLNADRLSAPAPPPSPIFGSGHEVENDSHEPGETVEHAVNKERSSWMQLAPSSPPTPSKVPVPKRLTQQDCRCALPENERSSSDIGLARCVQLIPQSVLRPGSHSPRERLAGCRQPVLMTQPVPPKGFEGALVCLQCSLPASSCQRRRQHLSSWQPLGQGLWPPPEMLKPVLSKRTKATTSSSSRMYGSSTASNSCLPSTARGNSSDKRIPSDRRLCSTEARAQDGVSRPARTQSRAGQPALLRASSSTQSLSASTRSLAASTTSLSGSVKNFKCLTARGAGAGNVAGGWSRNVK
eukprot:TRINITY_DN2355_c0_g1_i1.p1 TRINITY_DN2355_c0_g1~~TRINITY_DN2355_c0_g1_i1.p1  ORF type:complete len:553 (+),score=66.10 TRINITY_DN2355_c0_g1_i1:77-1735(+)